MTSKMADNDSWWTLIHWDDLDHWQQDNKHIQSYYRRASYNYRRSFASIFYLHNETVNIWSHLIPAVLSLPAATTLYLILKPRYDRATSADVLAMSCFFIGATVCLGMSATYHTLSNHSPNVSRKWNQLDYAGIACLIAGSFVPSVYYGFWCEPQKQILYWTMVSMPSLTRGPNIDCADWCFRGRMYSSVRNVEIQNTCMEANKSSHVRRYGGFRRLSCPRWYQNLWAATDEKSDRLSLARSPRSVVHYWGWFVCGTLHCSLLLMSLLTHLGSLA